MLNTRGNGVFRVAFEPKQVTPIEITAPFFSPWRVMAIGTPSDIVETQMFENLSPPCQISDTSWIKPGISSWTWFNGDPTGDPDVYKRYIDFSAEMGWEYVILDEGWQPRVADAEGPPPYDGRKSYAGITDWVPELVKYAEVRNVGVIVWSAWWDLDTPEKRVRLKEWADIGIRGVKLDFFNEETQQMLTLYDTITRETAELRLPVNYHGCHKPAGERRTWPHLVTREGVYGAEHYISGPGWGPTAEHDCSLPFTRNAVGPMDYTPAVSDYYGNSFVTDAHKGALAVVFESGIQCFSDKPDVYRSSGLYDLFVNIPAAWDNSKLLDGFPGRYAVMLRQKGGEYYIGSICNEQRTVDVTLDFLDENLQYTAEIFTDAADGSGVIKKLWKVKYNDILTLPQLEAGGAAMVIKPQPAPLYDFDRHWAKEYMDFLTDNGLLCGYFYGMSFYDFEEPITRAEFVAMLTSAFKVKLETGTPEFYDSVNHWTKNYIYTSSKNELVNGTGESMFAPDGLITREQALTIIGRMTEVDGVFPQLGFSDAAEISDYALPHVAGCVAKLILLGYPDNTFRPKNNITRAEAATIISRAAQL